MENRSSLKCSRLLRFIDGKTFDAVLGLPAQTYTGKDQEIFVSLREAARFEKERLHACKDPALIKRNVLAGSVSGDHQTKWDRSG